MAQTFSGFNVPQKWGQKTNYQGGQGGQLVTHALVTWRAIRPRNGIPPGTISGQWEQVPATITSPNVAQAVQAALPPPKPIAPKVVVTGSRPVNVSSNNVSVSVFQGSGDSAFSGLVPAPPNIAGTALFLREDGTWAAAGGGGGGTVTSVGLALPAELTVSGSPVIASGTLTGAWASETNNLVFAGPAVVPGTPTFRALVFADLPAGVGTVTSVGVSTDASYLTVGATPVTTSGTITVNKTTGLTANQFVATPSGAPGTADLRAIVPADLAGTPGAGKYWDGAGSGAWTALPAPGTGTVTSIAMSVPSFLSVAGSPVTTSGTFAVTLAAQSANNVFAGPTTGIAATPTFRSLVAADLPNTAVTPGSYTYSSITVDAQGRLTSASNGAAPTGTVTSVALSLPSIITVSGSPVTTSGTLTGTLATQTANFVWAGPTGGGAAAPTFRALVTADMPAGTGTVTSVALSMPSILTVSGSPVTTSGTLTAVLANQNANLGFLGPASGAAAAPTFRAIVPLDLATGGSSTKFYRGDGVYATPTGTSVGFDSGRDCDRPAASTLNVYRATDTGITYFSNGTTWQTAWGLDKVTVDSISTGFTDTSYFLGPQGVNLGPMMTNPYTLVFGFNQLSLPGTSGTIAVCYSQGTNGWYFGNSAVNSNKWRFALGTAFAANEINLTMTTGLHVIAINYNGTSFRYSLDGASVVSTATAAVYTAPSATASMFVGRWASTTLACNWFRFGFLASFSSAVSDADLQALSASPSTVRPGAITPNPNYIWASEWITVGSMAGGATGFPFFGSSSIRGATLAAQGVGIYKTNE